jgi:hypothetical protein
MQFTISDTTRGWIGGLISVASGAIGTAISTMIVAPQTFNFDTGTHKVIIVSAVSAIIAIGNYLARSPLPGVEIKKGLPGPKP